MMFDHDMIFRLGMWRVDFAKLADKYILAAWKVVKLLTIEPFLATLPLLENAQAAQKLTWIP